MSKIVDTSLLSHGVVNPSHNFYAGKISPTGAVPLPIGRGTPSPIIGGGYKNKDELFSSFDSPKKGVNNPNYTSSSSVIDSSIDFISNIGKGLLGGLGMLFAPTSMGDGTLDSEEFKKLKELKIDNMPSYDKVVEVFGDNVKKTKEKIELPTIELNPKHKKKSLLELMEIKGLTLEQMNVSLFIIAISIYYSSIGQSLGDITNLLNLKKDIDLYKDDFNKQSEEEARRLEEEEKAEKEAFAEFSRQQDLPTPNPIRRFPDSFQPKLGVTPPKKDIFYDNPLEVPPVPTPIPNPAPKPTPAPKVDIGNKPSKQDLSSLDNLSYLRHLEKLGNLSKIEPAKVTVKTPNYGKQMTAIADALTSENSDIEVRQQNQSMINDKLTYELKGELEVEKGVKITPIEAKANANAQTYKKHKDENEFEFEDEDFNMLDYGFLAGLMHFESEEDILQSSLNEFKNKHSNFSLKDKKVRKG